MRRMIGEPTRIGRHQIVWIASASNHLTVGDGYAPFDLGGIQSQLLQQFEIQGLDDFLATLITHHGKYFEKRRHGANVRPALEGYILRVPLPENLAGLLIDDQRSRAPDTAKAQRMF